MAQRSIVVSCFAGWHGFDLAQGLERAGLLQSLITLASPRQIEARYGIPRQRIHRLPLAPILHRLELWLTKHAGAGLKDFYYQAFCRVYDYFTQLFLTSRTTIIVAWYPFANRALLCAKKRGIVTALDVGSTHPHHQHAVLSREHQALGLPRPWMPNRVLANTWMFEQVDWIFVPSMAVRDSFIREGISSQKLLINPYGIDSTLFNSSPLQTRQGPFTEEYPLRVLVVAGLTPRKGSRLLLDICRHYLPDARIRFTLVGSLDPPYCYRESDLPGNLFVQHPLPHSELVHLFHQHHVCFLPSLEEGFARVLIEAAGCGLTLLATPPTGLADLLQRVPRVGYLLPNHQLSTALEALDRLIQADWPLYHPDPQSLVFFSRDAYQERAVQMLQSKLSNLI